MDPLPTMLRDFAKRALQWADTIEKQEDGVIPKELVMLLETPSSVEERGPFTLASELPPSSQPSLPWRRGDYFFCEGCGTRRQWWKDSPPWRGAICASCYNAELARIEAARGKKA